MRTRSQNIINSTDYLDISGSSRTKAGAVKQSILRVTTRRGTFDRSSDVSPWISARVPCLWRTERTAKKAGRITGSRWRSGDGTVVVGWLFGHSTARSCTMLGAVVCRQHTTRLEHLHGSRTSNEGLMTPELSKVPRWEHKSVCACVLVCLCVCATAMSFAIADEDDADMH